MPEGGQRALIVPPCGIQVGPGAVGGVITPHSLNQHVRMKMRTGNGRWEYKMEPKNKGKSMEKQSRGWGGGSRFLDPSSTTNANIRFLNYSKPSKHHC